MNSTELEGRDIVFSESYTEKVIKEHTGIYIYERNQRDLVKFTQFYWESVKGYGRYLKDVDFYDLTPDERENITLRAFYLWRNYRVETGKLV